MIEPIAKEMFFAAIALLCLCGCTALVGAIVYIAINTVLEIKQLLAKFERVGEQSGY